MKGHKENGQFHPHTQHQSAVHASDIQQDKIKTKQQNINPKEHAKQIMNEKLDKAGVGSWYRSRFPNDRSTIFQIAEHKAGNVDFGNVRFDLYGFPLKYADAFVEAVKDWKVAKQGLHRQHEESMIQGAIIRKKRAERFEGVSTSKLEKILNHEKRPEAKSIIQEELPDFKTITKIN